MSRVALAKGVRLEFPETSKVVTSDRILLNQLLQNLIGNALKYTEKGFVKSHRDIGCGWIPALH